MQSLIAFSLGNNENVVSNIEKLACCFCFDVYVLSPLCCGWKSLMKSCFKKYAMVLEQGASPNLNGKKDVRQVQSVLQ